MNFLRRWFGDRRMETEAQAEDRRKGGVLKRWKDAGDHLDSAVDMLNQTVSMNTAEFADILRRSREHELTLAHDSPWSTVEFVSFAETCKFRRPAGKDGIASVCTHPSHEASGTGIASCSRAQCPRDPRKAK